MSEQELSQLEDRAEQLWQETQALWKQQNEAVEFETFYRQKMNAIIEQLKSKLNPA